MPDSAAIHTHKHTNINREVIVQQRISYAMCDLLPHVRRAVCARWLAGMADTAFVFDAHMKCHHVRCPAMVSEGAELWSWEATDEG